MAENNILQKSLTDLLKDKSLQSKVEILQNKGTSTVLKISQIIPNPYQPRTVFDENKLNELASSIKQYGVFNPIIVREKKDKYEIVAGERRYRASIIAGLVDIPVIIENFTDQEMSEIALIENMQREDLSPLEISEGLHQYQATYKLTQNELANRMGKSRSYIANILRLRQLPQSIKNELNIGTISVGHIRTLIGLDESQAKEYLNHIKENKMNVRETEEYISSLKSKSSIKDKKNAEKQLKESLKTNVKLTKKEIKIEYKDNEELKSILEKLMRQK